jgi:hypothetical protein
MTTNNSNLSPLKQSKNSNADTGLRGSFNGDLYVDKKVFFNRPEVRALLEKLRNSPAYPKTLSK